MSGLVTAGVNAEQTLPYYAVLSTVAIHLTHQVRNMHGVVSVLAAKGLFITVQREKIINSLPNTGLKNGVSIKM